MEGEFSSRARTWRDRMDNQTFFTSLIFKMMYSIVLLHPILSYYYISCLTLSYVTFHRPESLQLVLFTTYLLFIFLHFLPVRAYHYHTIHSLVCACVFHAVIRDKSRQSRFLRFNSPKFSTLKISRTIIYAANNR